MKDFFKSRDLPTAALLLASPEIQFHGLEPTGTNTKYFLFSPKIRAEKLAMDFAAAKVTINARAYADAFRRSKDLLFQSERLGGNR